MFWSEKRKYFEFRMFLRSCTERANQNLEGLPIHFELKTLYCYWARFYSTKNINMMQWGKVRKFQSTSIKPILQRSRKGCLWQLHPDGLMQAWQFYALLVKVRLAHWWCAYYQSQQQSVQNYLIMLKTQSSAPLSPEPSSLNTAYAESRAISAAALGQAWAPSALIKCMAAKLWQAIN